VSSSSSRHIEIARVTRVSRVSRVIRVLTSTSGGNPTSNMYTCVKGAKWPEGTGLHDARHWNTREKHERGKRYARHGLERGKREARERQVRGKRGGLCTDVGDVPECEVEVGVRELVLHLPERFAHPGAVPQVVHGELPPNNKREGCERSKREGRGKGVSSAALSASARSNTATCSTIHNIRST
jgi:hypothetical protein